MINLLPEQYKKELRAQERFRLLIIFGTSFVVFLGGLSLLLLAIKISFAGQISAALIQLETFQEELSQEGKASREVEELNEKIGSIASFYEEQFLLSSVLQEISKALAPDMYLTGFRYTPGFKKKVRGEIKEAESEISVAGFSPSREKLFAFREELEKSTLLQKISFPPVNWVRAFDIPFTFTAKVSL